MVKRGATKQIYKRTAQTCFQEHISGIRCLFRHIPQNSWGKNVQRLKTIMTTWNPRACHVLYLHLMKWMLTQEMNGWQVQRSGAHTALCTLKYLRTCKRENSVTCVTTRYKTRNKRGYVNRSKQMGSFEKRRSLVHRKGRKRNGRSKVKNKQTNKYRQMGRRTDRWPDRQTDRLTDRPEDRQRGWQTDRETHRPKDRQTDKQADRKTDRETDKQTDADRQKDKQTDRDTG